MRVLGCPYLKEEERKKRKKRKKIESCEGVRGWRMRGGKEMELERL